jgi:hypothetical protein
MSDTSKNLKIEEKIFLAKFAYILFEMRNSTSMGSFDLTEGKKFLRQSHH